MTQATTKDYWISPSALYIELNALDNPDYIQASCVNGAQILVYVTDIIVDDVQGAHVKEIIGYDAGHNYRRWPLQAAPTVFNTHTEKYVYAAIPRDMTLSASAWIVFPSEQIDIYGKNEAEAQIGDEKYYYINLQGIITSSGDNGTVQRDWKQRIATGTLSSDEAISAIGSETEWYNYSNVDGIVTFLKDLTMQIGTKFRQLFAKTVTILSGGEIAFENQGEVNGVATVGTPLASTDKIVTPKFLDDNALSSVHDDIAKEKITFEKGIAFGQNGDTLIDGNGNAELLTLIVRQLLRSTKFRNGLTGEGWKIWLEDGLAKMELDELTVRRIMHVFELIIDKIRSVGGQIVVSAANGKIKTIEDAGDAYRIYFEGDNYFMPHDLMRCATYKNGKEQHGYWVEISEAYPDYIVVSKWEFIDGEAPRTGDEVVLMGNTEDDKRQNLILFSATEDGQPRIDVLNGVKNKNFTGCLRARFGNLDGIEDDYFPADSQPHGDGLYADNAYLRGTFILRNGKDVITQFNVLEGLINSSVEAIRKDFTEEDGYLNNPNFYSGFLHWYAPSDTKLYLLGDKWIWANDSALSNKGNGSQIKFDDGRTVVDIKNSYITQHNAEMRSKPEIHTNADGDKEPAVVYLSFFYKVIKSGTLRVNFENGNSDGFIAYETLSARMDVGVTDGYKQFTTSGYWNGTGDFKLSFTGEIYISTIIFSTDKADAMAYRYRTLFEQTDRLVKITAAVFDKDGEALKETGLVIKPEGAGLYAQDSNGKVALIGVSIEEDDGNGGTKSVIKLTADNIQLEGLITANENFKVLADGSIEAKNGKFIGTIDATSGTIGGFNINWWGIGKETQQGGTGNGLSINQHYISIGTAETYSYLGNDGRGILIDNESWDETWAGRFVNTKVREKQYNYGIYIDVENGTKNYGLFSNAPLQAPAYISLTKKDITIDGTGTVTFEFENHNLFMVNNTASDDTLVILPDENTVKNMFGYSKTIPLPSNFAAVFTIVMQKGSKSIMLANIINNDGNVNNERLAACDTMQLLCYVGTSGMIYQIINRKN